MANRIRMRRPTSSASTDRWFMLFVATRVVAIAVAAALLGAREVTDHDGLLITLGLAYGGASVLATVRWPSLQRLPLIWALDGLIALVLVLASEQWRSPFYLVALSSLVLPATALPFKRALAWGVGFTASYFTVALTTGIDWQALETTSGRLESFATHFMVPMLVVLALAYSAGLLRGLEKERNRSEELALEAERRRIALELHDSAKQRIHAAHLLLSSLVRSSSSTATIDHAMRELRAAAADLDANLSKLRAPLISGNLVFALQERATELERAAAGPLIEVGGETPELPTFLAAHTFHIVSEAMTNAARHSGAQHILVQLSHSEGVVRVVVSDDGHGMSRAPTSSDHGIRSMAERAELLGGTLAISATDENGRGTTVRLDVPLSN